MNPVEADFRQMLDEADRSLACLLRLRGQFPLTTGTAQERAVGLAIGGAVHHMRAATLLVREGRLLAAMALQRCAHECIDAAYLFSVDSARAEQWMTQPRDQVRPKESRAAIAQRQCRDGDVERTRNLSNDFYRAVSDHSHPTRDSLIAHYLQVQETGKIHFEVDSMHDSHLCKQVIVGTLGAVWYCWNQVLHAHRHAIAEEEFPRITASFRSACVRFGFPDFLKEAFPDS